MQETAILADERLSMEHWAAHLFGEFDSLDLVRLGACCTEGVQIRFGNNPVFLGRSAALEGIGGFWSTITGMSHKRIHLIVDGNQAVQLSDVTYTRHDGTGVTVPVASHIRRNQDGLLETLSVYIDLAPLFA